jgi:hypothetical protein
MDKVNKPKKQFPCPHCSEKPFTTLQNLKRHITRKHPAISETIQESDDVSVLSTDTTIISINYQSDNEPEIPQPLPSQEELIEIMNKYEKYQHLFPAIKRQMKWQEANCNVDMHFYLRKHTIGMRYNLYKISLLKCDSPIN